MVDDRLGDSPATVVRDGATSPVVGLVVDGVGETDTVSVGVGMNDRVSVRSNMVEVGGLKSIDVSDGVTVLTEAENESLVEVTTSLVGVIGWVVDGVTVIDRWVNSETEVASAVVTGNTEVEDGARLCVTVITCTDVEGGKKKSDDEMDGSSVTVNRLDVCTDCVVSLIDTGSDTEGDGVANTLDVSPTEGLTVTVNTEVGFGSRIDTVLDTAKKKLVLIDCGVTEIVKVSNDVTEGDMVTVGSISKNEVVATVVGDCVATERVWVSEDVAEGVTVGNVSVVTKNEVVATVVGDCVATERV